MACRLKTDEGHAFLMLTDGRVLDNRYDRVIRYAEVGASDGKIFLIPSKSGALLNLAIPCQSLSCLGQSFDLSIHRRWTTFPELGARNRYV
jgi:hypothetical protein